jgi:hypothetical protein
MSTRDPGAVSGKPPAPQWPQYRCHKIVSALQIDHIEAQEDAENPPRIYFIDDRFDPVDAAPDMFARYTPVHGDYFVLYSEGYASISPKAVFEDGYTRIG